MSDQEAAIRSPLADAQVKLAASSSLALGNLAKSFRESTRLTRENCGKPMPFCLPSAKISVLHHAALVSATA